MHFVGRVDWSFADEPTPETATSAGLARRVLIGPAQGAVHTELAVGAMAPGGWLARHVHSFEEGLYLLEGELILELDGHVHRLMAGDYALIPIATQHTLVAPPRALGSLAVDRHAATPTGRMPRSPTRSSHAGGPTSTRSSPGRCPWPCRTSRAATSVTTRARHRRRRRLRLTEPARGRRPAGADTALIAYSGISVKMLIDKVLGADHMTLFTVDYEIGGAAPGARPPVRGDVLLPGRRGRGRARRDRRTRSSRETSCSPASRACTASGMRAPNGSAGSRPRRPNRRHAAPIAGSRRWERMAAQGVERWPDG